MKEKRLKKKRMACSREREEGGRFSEKRGGGGR